MCVEGKCAVSATDLSDPDLHGMGAGCTVQSGAGATSCLLDGRINAAVRGNRNGCGWFSGLNGVVCCADSN